MTRDINLVVVLSAAAQVAAFLKSILIAYFFGVSPELDGYFLAQVVPVVVTGTAIGVLQSSFVPAYVRLKAEGKSEAAAHLAGGLLRIILVAGGGLAAIVAVLAAPIVHLTAPLADPAVTAAAIYSLRVLSMLLLLNALADFLALLLNAELRFAAAALAPIGNAAVASAFLLMAPELGLANLVWGTLLGLATHVAVLIYSLKRARIPVHLSAAASGGHVRTIGGRSMAALPAVVIANVASNVPSLLAAGFGPGAVSAFSYAWKLNQAATQAAGIALGTVLLPHFSGLLARKDYASISASIARIVPLVFAIGGLALVWVWVAGEPFLATAFKRGKFSSDDAQAVHQVWLVLTVGLAPTIASIALAKVIQASQGFAQLAWFGLSGLVVLCLVSAGLRSGYEIEGVAVGVIASAWSVFALCAVAVQNRLPAPVSWGAIISFRRMLPIFTATAAATALVGLVPGFSALATIVVSSMVVAGGATLLARTQ